jgi:hypothetical protein
MAKTGRKVGWMKPGLEARAHPSLLDIAWAAGVYEGEGTCGRNSEVSVTQKDRWILERLQYLFGGHICKSGPSRTCSLWQISGSRGRGFLMTIFSFLSPRRKAQARLTLVRERERHFV